MSDEYPASGAEVSEADRVDQAIPVFPEDVAEGFPEASGPDGFVSEADWLEQQREVPLPDDSDDGDAG